VVTDRFLLVDDGAVCMEYAVGLVHISKAASLLVFCISIVSGYSFAISLRYKNDLKYRGKLCSADKIYSLHLVELSELANLTSLFNYKCLVQRT